MSGSRESAKIKGAAVILSGAKDLRSCRGSVSYEELQGCFATLSKTDSNSLARFDEVIRWHLSGRDGQGRGFVIGGLPDAAGRNLFLPGRRLPYRDSLP